MTFADPATAQLFGDVPVIPVLVIDQVADAVPLGKALVSGGLRVLEVTLRTPAALEAVEEISSAVSGAVVGVGSVIDAAQFAAAARAGARFAVSPGATPQLHAAAEAAGLPWLPGAQTISEVLALRASGCRFMKFFPAHAAGGVIFLRSVAGPVPDVSFCPTGGISAANAAEYLALANVRCVGGSWLTPPELLAAQRWDEITTLAREAAALRAGRPSRRD